MIILTLSNQKGGSTKTTTTVHLATGLARRGYRVLVMDNDAQGNTTGWLGAKQPPDDCCDVVDVMLDSSVTWEDVIEPTDVEHVDIVASTQDMQGADVMIMGVLSNRKKDAEGKEVAVFKLPDGCPTLDQMLLHRLENLPKDRWDFVIIDTSPGMGIVTRNSIVAADFVIIPVDVSYLAFEGTGSMMTFLNQLGKANGKKIHVLGALATIHEAGTTLCQGILNGLHDFFVQLLFGTKIRKSVRLKEASAAHKSAYDYAPKEESTIDYQSFCEEVIQRIKDRGVAVPPAPFPPKPLLELLPQPDPGAAKHKKKMKRKRPLRRDLSVAVEPPESSPAQINPAKESGNVASSAPMPSENPNPTPASSAPGSSPDSPAEQ